NVYFDRLGYVETKIYERSRLRADDIIDGTAVIEEAISCTVVTPGRRAAGG
ncbi:MAG: hypothetical protein HY770_03845, partial [Chitinivibrionia bacterium]|nr:hypothetical protein [Chitinivibrionia bacterium]